VDPWALALRIRSSAPSVQTSRLRAVLTRWNSGLLQSTGGLAAAWLLETKKQVTTSAASRPLRCFMMFLLNNNEN